MNMRPHPYGLIFSGMYAWSQDSYGSGNLTLIHATVAFTVMQFVNVLAMDALVDAMVPQDLLVGWALGILIFVTLLALNGAYATKVLRVAVAGEIWVPFLGKQRSASSLAKAYTAASIMFFFLSAIPLWGTG